MAHVADTWPAYATGERRTVRVLAALAVSVLCHATVLVLVRGWRLEGSATPLLVVTMVERGGGEGAGAGEARQAATIAGAPAPLAVAAAPPTIAAAPPAIAAAPPAVAAVPPAIAPALVAPPRPVAPHAARHVDPPAPPRVSAATRSRITSPSAAGLEATVSRERAVEAPPAETVTAATDSTAAAARDGAAAAGGGTGSANDGRGGSGAGRGGGAGNAVGTGSDGLRAFCARCPAPDYPGRARRQGWQGTVDVELAIARDGAVAEARIGRSSGYPTLDEVALDVARQSRFTVPAGGDDLHGQLRYRFVLDEATARR